MAQCSRMRDFALPAITSLKARLAVASREQNGQSITEGHLTGLEYMQAANPRGELGLQSSGWRFDHLIHFIPEVVVTLIARFRVQTTSASLALNQLLPISKDASAKNITSASVKSSILGERDSPITRNG